MNATEKLNKIMETLGLAKAEPQVEEIEAKELGVEDVRKMFGARGDEAKYYTDVVGKAATKIETAARSI